MRTETSLQQAASLADYEMKKENSGSEAGWLIPKVSLDFPIRLKFPVKLRSTVCSGAVAH
jgi:hypothetical protein